MKIRMVSLLIVFLAMWGVVHAQQSKSRRVRQLEQQRKEVQQRIEHTDRRIKELKRSSKNEEKQLKLVHQRVQQKEELIGILNNEVGALQQQIDSLSGRLSALSTRETKLLKQYRMSLRSLQRTDRETELLLFLFSASTLEEAVRRQQFVGRYMLSSRQIIDSLRAVRWGLQQTQQSLGEHQIEKKKLAELRDRERRELQSEVGRRTAQVKKLQTEQNQLERELKRQQRQADQLERRIHQQIAHEIKRAEEQARRAREARRRRQDAKRASKQPSRGAASSDDKDTKSGVKSTETPLRESELEERQADTHGGYAMDHAERALAGSFRQNKGKLPMPVRGRYQLVYRFGQQPHQSLKHVQVSKNGIDIRVLQDKKAYAVFSGTVTSVLVVPGYERSVILRHGNYLTVYSNLINVSVRPDHKVRSGEVLGTIATPPGEKHPLLHFQVWYELNPRDPLPWLRK